MSTAAAPFPDFVYQFVFPGSDYYLLVLFSFIVFPRVTPNSLWNNVVSKWIAHFQSRNTVIKFLTKQCIISFKCALDLWIFRWKPLFPSNCLPSILNSLSVDGALSFCHLISLGQSIATNFHVHMAWLFNRFVSRQRMVDSFSNIYYVLLYAWHKAGQSGGVLQQGAWVAAT